MQASFRKLGSAGLRQSWSAWRHRLWYNPGLSNRVYFGTGAMGLMLIIFPALLGALATAKEYEIGTIIQAYASSLTAVQWILGKALLYVLIGIVEFVICFTLGYFAFGYNFPVESKRLARRHDSLSVCGSVFRNDDGQLARQPERRDSGRADGFVSAFVTALRILVCCPEYTGSRFAGCRDFCPQPITSRSFATPFCAMWDGAPRLRRRSHC